MNQHPADGEFDSIVAALELRHHEDIRRIASAVFCTIGIEPSVVTFAKRRVALHRQIDEDIVDVGVTASLLEKATRVMAELRRLEAV
jgi:hypothetical protein